MGGQQDGGNVVRVQGDTRRHRRKRRRGSGDGARGQQRVVVGMDGWDGSGVFTHRGLCVHHCAHLHQRVDERQSPLLRCVVKQGPMALRTHTQKREDQGSRGGAAFESLTSSNPILVSLSSTTLLSNWAKASWSPPSSRFSIPVFATANCSKDTHNREQTPITHISEASKRKMVVEWC